MDAKMNEENGLGEEDVVIDDVAKEKKRVKVRRRKRRGAR